MTLSPLANPSHARQTPSFSPKQVLKILISVVLLGFLLQHIGLENVLHKLSKANLWYIPVGVVVYLVGQLISAYRWQFLSAALNFKLALREFYDYYLIGMFFNLFLPGAIGGDVLRLYYLAKSTGRRKREALLTLLAERGVGLVALLLLTSAVCLSPALQDSHLAIPITLPFLNQPLIFDLSVLLVFLSTLLLLGYFCLWLVPLQALTQKFPKLALLDQAKVYWANLGLLAKSVSISLFVHAMMIVMHLLIAQALHTSVNPFYMTVVYGVVSLASVLPIAFNGFGVREGAYLLLLTKAGLQPDTALAFAVYWDIISTCTSLIGGLVLLKGHYKTPTAAEQADLSEELA
ncbi:lysylphosphatidylglycerol synthase transmembrane domain-containing protein [Vampirovibrio chlorellavorus]|uniref:lysylphosphatidylglycerol synthase transmembrane domain-containing protein n=1 Tax=Vampirovibrio chlorellavorus TaxID=758823 RepID=UPI0026E92BD8|nr:lysylphosphatidylglycerol synthase transmembrane domain-containing protein [Vampirovibrio chlorellavorus]